MGKSNQNNQTLFITVRINRLTKTHHDRTCQITWWFFVPRQPSKQTPLANKTDIQIVNLSSRKLNGNEIKLLEKGLKFTPTPLKPNIQELNEDITEFTRNIRLVEYFEGNEDENDESLVRNKSNWIPPKGRDKDLESFFSNVRDIPLHPNKNKNIKYNLSKPQQNCIASLANDKNIIIKEADKDGATVIMDTSFYREQIDKLLSNPDYYKQLEESPHKDIMKGYSKYIEKYKSNLTGNELDYLLNFERKTSSFYGLPKTHKYKDINNACSISNKNYVELEAPESLSESCETHRLSNIIDILLQPYTKHIKSYIKDTSDFLSKLPTSTNPDTLLVSFDVVNLYTNIPHDLGIEVIEYWLRKFPQELPARISVEFLLEGIKFILENNYFCFNDTYFLQTKGTAIGTKFAPIYATLVLGYLEETLYRKVEDVFDLNFKTYIEENFKRFSDDCFILFRKSDEDLTKLHELINTLHLSLNFTMDKSRIRLSFLDTMVINNNGEVQTDIFHKPTDSKPYLLYTSCYPKHTRTASLIIWRED